MSAGRTWIYVYYGGWAHGEAQLSLWSGGTAYHGEFNIATYGGNEGWTHMGTVDAIVNSSTDLTIRCRKINASQGSYGVNAQVMCVPLAPIENAIGRQITLAEARAWIGYSWNGNKTIIVTP